MLPKSLGTFTIILACFFAMIKSQTLAQSNFPYSSSRNFNSIQLGTTYMHYIPAPSPNAKESSVSQFATTNQATGYPSSLSSTTNLATGSSVSQPSTTSLLTSYAAPPSPSNGLATGPSVSQPSTTSLLTSYAAPLSPSNGLATEPSVSQRATTSLLTSYAAPPSPSNGLATGLSASKPATNSVVTRSFESRPVIAGSVTGFLASQLPPIKFTTALSAPPQSNANQQPTLTNPAALRLANCTLEALMASETFKDLADSELRESSNLFFNYGHNLLTNAGISDPHVLASVVSQSVESLHNFPLNLFFSATVNTLSKYLFSKGLLTAASEPLYCQKVIGLVDQHPFSKGTQSTESIVTIMGDAFFGLLSSIGALNSIDDMEKLFHMFSQDLKSGNH